jgi:tetratricopeptide (TPR) repeat protein
MEGEEPAKAFRYFRLAGDAAASHFAHEEAILHFEHARSILGDLETDRDSVGHVYQRLGRERELVGDYGKAQSVYQDLLDRSLRAGDKRLELTALLASATLHCTPTPFFDLEKGEAITQRALEISHSLNDREAEAKVLWLRMLLLGFGNQPAEAVRVGEEAIALARSLGLKEQLAFALNDITTLYAGEGRIDTALAAADEAHALWTELGNLPMLTDVLSNSAMIHGVMGEWDRALALAEEAYQISLSIENLWGRSFSRMFVGFIYLERGDISRALAIMRESVEYGERVGFLAPQVFVRGWLGVAHAALGEVDEGIALTTLAGEKARVGLPTWGWAPIVFLAEIFARTGRADEAARLLEPIRAEGVEADPTRSLVFYPIPLTRARVELSQGLAEQAAETCRALDELLLASRMVAFRVETLHLWGQSLQALGNAGAAAQRWQEALSIAERQENRLTGWEIHLDLANSSSIAPEQQEIHRRAARETAQYLADHIAEEPLRESFLQLPRVRQALSAS